MKLEKIPASHYPQIRAWLNSVDLPTEDVDTHIHFFGLATVNKTQAIGGLEIWGPYALLRSVMRVEGSKGEGIGSTMVSKLEQQASDMGVQQVFLLTTTAAGFFSKLGYEVIPRNEVPETVAGSQEFSSLCPDSAVCMTKKLL